MNRHPAVVILSLLVVSSPSWAEQSTKAKSSTTSPVAAAVEPPSHTKTVAYNQRDVVRVNTRVRYTTLIVLPKDEVILDFVCGDKDLWVISGEQNFAYVKPAKEGSETNLNLVTQAGNIYSFILSEVSGAPARVTDLKVFIEPTDPAITDATRSPRRFVSVQELEQLRQETQLARNETQQVKASAQEAIDRGIQQFVTDVRFAYRYEAGKKPFNVRSMYHDERFTYIQARPEETPTLMEVRDGKPNLVNFSYANGLYVAEKIIDRGYLVVGKERLAFSRQE